MPTVFPHAIGVVVCRLGSDFSPVMDDLGRILGRTIHARWDDRLVGKLGPMGVGGGDGFAGGGSALAVARDDRDVGAGFCLRTVDRKSVV